MKIDQIWMKVSACALFLLLCGTAALGQGDKAKKNARALSPVAQWLWVGKPQPNQTVHLRGQFKLPAQTLENAKAVRLIATCDNEMVVYVNGKKVASSTEWQTPVSVDIHKQVIAGENIIAVEATNDGGTMAGFVAQIEFVTQTSRESIIHVSDKTWVGSAKASDGWNTPDFDAPKAGWTSATVLAAHGAGPWNNVLGGAGAAAVAANGPQVNAPEGFKVDLIYAVPKGQQGSWVAITALPDGRLVASDQGGQGLYYITPPKIGQEDAEAKIEKLPVDISNAQGLVWAFDSLYVNRNGGGLWRVTDSNNDGKLDKAEQIVPLNGGGEHGPHAVIVTEDGKGLYIVGGNHTDIPPNLTGSRQPMNWGEDLLLPRQWDARGHARGKLAPGGWVARVSPDGKERVLYSNGFRNEYDIALNRDGEMFTFDSDMEWDFGMPWYRPTRVNHVTSGSEFGWRSGTGKWPAHYPDSLPAVVDIGPASPVGVNFGYGTAFPAKWQDALYILDWTYGTIWAVHLKEDGASYTGEVEEFISGTPLPVTDATVGNDGAFYFTVGGRGTQSALYRVTYVGDESVEPSRGKGDPKAAALRKLRRSLEEFHGVKDSKAVAAAWPHLGHEDRFIRYAARIAIEAQPVDQWRDKALAQSSPQALITAMVALARQGSKEDLGGVLTALHKIDLESLPEQQLLEALRAYQLAFIRLGKPDEAWRSNVVAKLDKLFPGKSDDANRELVQLLVYLDSPTVIEKTMKLIAELKPEPQPEWATVLSRNSRYGGTAQKMLENMPPLQGIAYAFALRNMRFGWTIPQREAYFKFINEASKHPGGASFAGFLTNIRKEALANASEAERFAVSHLTGENLQAPPTFKVNPVKGPGKEWTMKDAVATVGGGLAGRSFENGRNVYHAIGCVKCHRFDGAGGAVGPDLSSVGTKFSTTDLLEAIIEPNKVISDQYASHIVRTVDGDVLTGIVIETENGGVEVHTSDLNAEPVKLKKGDIASKQVSKTSQMPAALINVINKDELLDLLAYLISRGNPDSPLFKK